MESLMGIFLIIIFGFVLAALTLAAEYAIKTVKIKNKITVPRTSS